jgi:hypothetical protein
MCSPIPRKSGYYKAILKQKTGHKHGFPSVGGLIFVS